MKRNRSVALWVVLALLIPVRPALSYVVPTHRYLLEMSIRQLYADCARALTRGDIEKAERLYKVAEFWEEVLDSLKQGAEDIDFSPWLNDPFSWPLSHGWNSETKLGWLWATPATTLADQYEAQALAIYLQSGDKKRLAWHIGAVCHLIADLTVPFHWSCSVFETKRHSEHEHICERIMARLTTKTEGIYALPGVPLSAMPGTNASEWVKYAAGFGQTAYDQVKSDSDEARSHDESVGLAQMQLAVRLGAGYLYNYYYYLYPS